MKFRLVFAALFATACTSSGAWRQVETENFVLRTNLETTDAKRAAVALESTRDALVSAAWPRVRFIGAKTEVYVLANGIDFERYFGRGTHGFYHRTHPPRFFLYGSADRWELRRRAYAPARSVLRHEMAHQLSDHVWPRQSRWFAEGLASFLETVYYAEDGTSVVMGGVNDRALEAYRAVRYLTVDDALAWTESAGNMPHRQAAGLYGLSWLLVHWFYHRYPQALERYIEALQSGASAHEAFRKALPQVDPSTVDRALFEYQQQIDSAAVTMPLAETPIAEGALQEQFLGPGEVEKVQEALAEAARRNATGSEREARARTVEEKAPRAPAQAAGSCAPGG